MADDALEILELELCAKFKLTFGGAWSITRNAVSRTTSSSEKQDLKQDLKIKAIRPLLSRGITSNANAKYTQEPSTHVHQHGST